MNCKEEDEDEELVLKEYQSDSEEQKLKAGERFVC